MCEIKVFSIDEVRFVSCPFVTLRSRVESSRLEVTCIRVENVVFCIVIFELELFLVIVLETGRRASSSILVVILVLVLFFVIVEAHRRIALVGFELFNKASRLLHHAPYLSQVLAQERLVRTLLLERDLHEALVNELVDKLRLFHDLAIQVDVYLQIVLEVLQLDAKLEQVLLDRMLPRVMIGDQKVLFDEKLARLLIVLQGQERRLD